jgi:hypothetical protein
MPKTSRNKRHKKLVIDRLVNDEALRSVTGGFCMGKYGCYPCCPGDWSKPCTYSIRSPAPGYPGEGCEE